MGLLGLPIFEIVLNVKGRFVGTTFVQQSYLQFAAKAHENVIPASVATILFSYFRYQIGVGKEMPFGAVSSGSQSLQVSHLWPIELWSSVLSKEFQLRRKIYFTDLILTCVIVAATAGPSSARLLLAQQSLWPSNSLYVAVNASPQDLWPDRIDDGKIERACAVVRLDSLDETPRLPPHGPVFFGMMERL